MTWIRGGPMGLDARNITEAIDSRLVHMCALLQLCHHLDQDSGGPLAILGLICNLICMLVELANQYALIIYFSPLS